jgi:xanthine/uracil permease
MALAAIIGVILNLIIPERKEDKEFVPEVK